MADLGVEDEEKGELEGGRRGGSALEEEPPPPPPPLLGLSMTTWKGACTPVVVVAAAAAADDNDLLPFAVAATPPTNCCWLATSCCIEVVESTMPLPQKSSNTLDGMMFRKDLAVPVVVADGSVVVGADPPLTAVTAAVAAARVSSS